MELNLAGKRVVISGGTRGIGRAIVDAFIAEGAQVSFCARTAEQVTELERVYPQHCFGDVVDVSDAQAVSGWIQRAGERMQGIDIVVPNVSALEAGAAREVWERSVNTDLLGTVSMVQATLPWLADSSAAAVVIISSVSGRMVDAFAEPYGTMKAALLHYGKTLSDRLAAQHIRVNTVSPGNIYFRGGIWARVEAETPEVFKTCLAMNPLGRMGKPEEVASAVLFLASPVASFITGSNLIVDGGLVRSVQF